MLKKRIGILIVALLVIGSYIHFDLGQYLQLSYLKDQKETLEAYVNSNLATAAISYFLIYVLTTAFSIPGATIITLAGGALFGQWLGTFLVSFASCLGATLAFLIARMFLRDWVENKFPQKIAAVNQGVEEEGAAYLFSLRLLPVFPFFLINLTMGLTKLRVSTFFFVSQIGMLPGTFIYVNAGTQLANISSLKDILSIELIASFALIGLFPIATKKIMAYRKKNKPQ